MSPVSTRTRNAVLRLVCGRPTRPAILDDRCSPVAIVAAKLRKIARPPSTASRRKASDTSSRPQNCRFARKSNGRSRSSSPLRPRSQGDAEVGTEGVGEPSKRQRPLLGDGRDVQTAVQLGETAKEERLAGAATSGDDRQMGGVLGCRDETVEPSPLLVSIEHVPELRARQDRCRLQLRQRGHTRHRRVSRSCRHGNATIFNMI